MAEVTVKQLADEVGIPVDRLLTQLDEAGIGIQDAEASINDADKMQLLRHLRTARSSGHDTRVGGASSSEGESEGGPRKISLRRKSTSELRLSGGRGRARTVNVEVRKRRTYVRRGEPDEEAAAERDRAALEAQQAAEAEARARAEAEEAERRAEEERQEKERLEAEQARQAAEEEARRQAEEAEEAERRRQEDAAKTESESQAQVAAEAEAEAAPAAKAETPAETRGRGRRADAGAAAPVDEGRLEMQATRRRAQENLRRAAVRRREGDGREDEAAGRRQELHVAKGKSGRRKKKGKAARGPVRVETQHGFERPTAPVVREIEIPEAVKVGELAQKMAVKAPDLIKVLMKLGVMATINQTLDQDTAVLVVEEMGHRPKLISEDSVEDAVLEQSLTQAEGADQRPRPPVITIMGHVDHGKTSLLDYIRKTRVASGESGGITQHIGAYHVETPRGLITFLDTPGHAAFTRMRARGAGLTDIVVLVVAADDGVMPQTQEAIEHARAAGVPMVVALTKVDREQADPDRVKSELAQIDIIPEDWGGDTQFVNVSGVTGEGVEDLLESLALQAEIMELKAPVDVPARGVVVESSLEKGRGPVATVLVKAGTLHQGDTILSGRFYGRVRAMFNERGESVKEVGPSLPAEVLGLSGTPDAGDEMFVIDDERKAREIANMREMREREAKLAQQQATRLDDMFSQMQSGETLSLNVMVKADVQGSVEALAEALQSLSGDDITIKIVARGVGGISESDVDLAVASDAIIIGFNVRADGQAKRRIQETGVDVRYYSVIYNVINDVRDAASGMLGTETREQIVGLAEVRDVFKSSRLGAIAGCLVVEGSVRRGLPIRVLRDNVVIFEGELESLRRHKDDVQRVDAGTECGIGVKNYNDVRPGDQIENFERVEVKRTL